MKKFLIGVLLFSLFVIRFPLGIINVANAASPGSIVINEVAWMGTTASTSEEWIELYNTTGSDIDLSNWTIDDDGAETYTITSGTITAGGYFLIEDAVINLSLSNTGDSLILIDNLDQTIDTVNGTGGMWFAGDNTNKFTMERIDPIADGDDSLNWADSLVIDGTPGAVNSVHSGAPADTEILIGDLAVNPVEGDAITLTVSIANATDVLSYGFDITYDPLILAYTGASEDSFLSESGSVPTAFNEGLENGIEGKIVIGNSRITAPPSGISGAGDLFTLNFDAIASGSTDITFNPTSFISNTAGDITATLDSDTITVDPQTIDPATNLSINEGANRYELTLNWDAPITGADSYKILRRDQAGAFIEITNIASTSYTDANNLIPTQVYEYRVIAVKGSLESTPLSGQSADSRGIKGDNNRSDRVDGRDLNNLALHYTQTLADPNFDALIDTTYDGQIDGSDLIDIGANWAIRYEL